MKKLAALLLAVGLLFLGCDDVAELLKSSDCTITGLSIENMDISVDIDAETKTITVTVPYGTSVTAIMPVVTFTGTSISPAAGTILDFSSPQKFTITAEDGSEAVYTVKVVVADPLSDAKAITSFGFTVPSAAGTIDEAAGTIAVDVPYGTDVSALEPAITHTGASISPADGAAQDFTSAVTYTVTAEDGSENPYVVTVSVEEDNVVPTEIVGTWYADGGISAYVLDLTSDGEWSSWEIGNEIEKDTGTFEVDGTDVSIKTDMEMEVGSYAYSVSGSSLDFSLISDADEDRRSIALLDWSKTEPVTYDLTGTVDLPETVVDKDFFVAVDTNMDGSDGFKYVDGTITSSNQISFEIDAIIAGTYYVYAIVDMDDSWGDDDAGPPNGSDFYGVYGTVDGVTPTEANLVLDADKDINFDAPLVGGLAATGDITVSGTISLPGDFDSSDIGKSWLVAVDPTIQDAGDDRIYVMGTVTNATSFTYEIANVPDGSYYVYAAVDLDDTWGTDVEDDITAGDLFGAYGVSNMDFPQTPNVSITDDITLDFEVEVYGGGPAVDGAVLDISEALGANNRALSSTSVVTTYSADMTVMTMTVTNYYDSETGLTIDGTMSMIISSQEIDYNMDYTGGDYSNLTMSASPTASSGILTYNDDTQKAFDLSTGVPVITN